MEKLLKKIGGFFTRCLEKDINYKEALDMINFQNAKFIAVRSIQEYNEGHLDGAICIPLYELRKEIPYRIQNRDSIIILYCSSGIRSLKGKKILDSLGYRNVYNLKGGIDNIKA